MHQFSFCYFVNMREGSVQRDQGAAAEETDMLNMSIPLRYQIHPKYLRSDQVTESCFTQAARGISPKTSGRRLGDPFYL